MSSSKSWALRSRRIVLPEGEREGAVLVRDERIAAIVPASEIPPDYEIVDVGESAVLPGLVDTHAHINEPGRTDWEGFETATRAAAAGGITSIVDMPLNSIPATTTLEALKVKRREAEGKCQIDHGFWGGVVPGNLAQLEPMIRAGVMGFKCFLIESGVEEFPHVSEADLRLAMPILARHKVPLLVHAELEGPLPTPDKKANSQARKYKHYLASRPMEWENRAIELMIGLCRETGCAVHIVHLSSASALPAIERARREGLPFSVETCPHYLSFASEEIPDGATYFKCAPPIREKSNRERLWRGLEFGQIDFIVSDHSPCVPKLKLMEKGDFAKAWGGISSLQFGLPVIWTHMRERSLSLSQLVQWMSLNTARFAGLSSRKGALRAGLDADLVVFDTEAKHSIDSAHIHHKHRVTPYEGYKVRGQVRAVYLRGKKIYECDSKGKEYFAPKPLGKPLHRAQGDK